MGVGEGGGGGGVGEYVGGKEMVGKVGYGGVRW